MLSSALPVLREILKSFPEGGVDLETITRLVVGVTRIDRVHFIEYDVTATNPILGEFRRFRQHDGVYAGKVTIVEVRYAKHLSPEERQLVVCKELCHSLEAPDDRHVSDQGIIDLVAAFSLVSGHAQRVPRIPTSFGIEVLAMMTAVEILCPITLRRKLNSTSDLAAVASHCRLPLDYVQAAIEPTYLSTCETLLREFGIDF